MIEETKRLYRENAGVSLLEVLVVLVILSFSVSIAYPRFKSTLFKSTLSEKLNDLKLLMNSARTSAIASGKTQFVLIDIANRKFSIGGRKNTVSFYMNWKISAIVASELITNGNIGKVVYLSSGRSSGATITVTDAKQNTGEISVHWLNSRAILRLNDKD